MENNIESLVATEEQGLSLPDIMAFLKKNKWLITSVVLVFLVIGIFSAKTAPPIYRSEALLQVEEKKNQLAPLKLSETFQDKPPISDEVQILTSRMVLQEVVEIMKLDLRAGPEYPPVIGALVASLNKSGTELPLPWKTIERYGWDVYAWGGESIKLESFEVPKAYVGEKFRLVASGNEEFQLFIPIIGTEEYQYPGDGKVGKLLEVSVPSNPEEKVRLFLSRLEARDGVHFNVQKVPLLTVTNRLQSMITVEQLGRESRLLRLNMEGQKPGFNAKLINHVVNIYVRQNVERMSAEAESSLKFIEEQLPSVKEHLKTAKAELNEYKLKKGSIDLPMETQIVLNQIVSVETQISKLQRSKKELSQKFTGAHPRIRTVNAKIAALKKDLEKLNDRVKELPATQQDIVGYTRNVDVATQLYTHLLNKRQELNVVKAGTIGYVRIIDYALPSIRPVGPNRQLLIAMYVILGAMLGIGAALARQLLRRGVGDPEIIEQKLGIPVYGAIPQSALQKKLKLGKRGRRSVLANECPDDLSVESLRSLRTSMHFALVGSKSNRIMITGPAEGVGKSFISVNLGAVLANVGKRVLLIDGDLRKGHIHDYFGLGRQKGLSNIITGEVELAEVTIETYVENLHLITTGVLPPNPSELLMHETFPTLLENVSGEYDYVIIDSPPVLAVTDASIIGNLTDATILVLRAGEHSLREIAQATKRLRQSNVDLKGIVFNGINLNAADASGEFYGYASAYKYGEK